MRVLCADDQEIHRVVVRQHLRRTDLNVDLVETRTYAETLSAIASQPFDCVLLDYRLGDGNGLDLLQNIRAQGINVPVIVLTGTGNERIAVEFMKAGASDYLPKTDLSPLLLSRAILSAINVQRADVALQAQHRAEGRADLLASQALELQESRHLLASSISVITEGYVLQDSSGAVIISNKSAEEILGAPAGNLLGRDDFDGRRFINEDYSEIPIERRPSILALTTGETQAPRILGIVSPGGDTKWLSMGAAPLLRPDEPAPYAVVATFTDVTAQRRAEAENQQAQADLRLRDRAIEAAGDSILICDPLQHDCPVIYCNPAFTAMTGYGLEEVIGHNCRFLQGPGTDRTQVERLRNSLAEMSAVQVVLKNYRKDGSEFWNEVAISPVRDQDGRVTHFIGVLADVTERIAADERREQALREAQEQADRDPLTNLLNHRAFQKRLKDETIRAQSDGSVFAVIMADLDNFKLFNDAYGHATGDNVIRVVAERIEAICSPPCIAARFGGDEFAVIIPNVDGAKSWEIEKRLQKGLDGIYYRPSNQENIPVSISLGAALFPQGDLDNHEILRQANDRLHWAKTGGGGNAEAHRVRSYANKHVKGFSMLDALVTAVDNKDQYTRNHSEDVMTYCLMIGREFGMDDKTLETISVAALLHDVGKIGVPDAILRKPGKLTEEEFDAIKQHPQMGAIIVSAVPGLEETLDSVRHHHERWDGAGYPFGLRGEETPLMARLMAVADAFSAMTTDRPYRQGMPKEKALSILTAGAGEQWCPTCVAAFKTAIATHHPSPRSWGRQTTETERVP